MFGTLQRVGGAVADGVSAIARSARETDRDKVGFLGGIFKSKKLGATFVWGAVCEEATRYLLPTEPRLALVALSVGTLGVGFYVMAQALSERGTR